MIFIKSVEIRKFRAFKPDTCFSLGRGVTLIAGLNGTAKSTLLGMICQPIGFPTSDKKSIYTGAYTGVSLKECRTLFGTYFKSSISDVFRFSKIHDKPREHNYVVRIDSDSESLLSKIAEKGLSVRSEARGGQEKDKLRIVTNSDVRDSGSGNFPHPVIYLGLDRLRPLSTVETVKMSMSSELSEQEKKIWRAIYSEVMLCSPSEGINSGLLDTERGGKQKYESVSATNYDGESASAGQDNLSQIITAIISFYRLKKDLGDKYQGGVLLIDEVDATFHPFSQVVLLQQLIRYSNELGIQIVATTHSLFLLKAASREYKKSTRLLFLEKSEEDGYVHLLDDVRYEDIDYKLSLVREKHKIRSAGAFNKGVVLFEDEVASMFFKCVTRNLFKTFITIYSAAGRNNETALPNNILASIAKYIAPKKIPQFENVIYVLDGDSKSLLNERAKNLLCLPGEAYIEQEVYSLLHTNDTFSRKALKNMGVDWQACFIGFNSIENDSPQDRKKRYKKWFRDRYEKGYFGRGGIKVFRIWEQKHRSDCRKFCMKFLETLRIILGPSFERDNDVLKERINQKFPE